MTAIEPRTNGGVVHVLAHPGSNRDAIMGERAGAVRVAVTAAPEKGKANAAIQSVLAQTFGCSRNQIILIAGETSRRKKFLIEGITTEELGRRLAPLIVKSKSAQHDN